MIDSIKDLEKLLKLCRKQGVTEIKFGGVEFKLGDLPHGETKPTSIPIGDEEDPFLNFPPGMLTKEQAIFYSSGGHPDDDPENAEAQQ